MKTRRQREQLEVFKRRMRLLETRLRIAPFHNPYTSYKIGEVIISHIQNFFFDEVEGEPQLSTKTFFKWHCITSATSHSDRVVLSLTPINQEGLASERYVVERFRSFGRKDLNEFAVKLEQLIENSRYEVQESALFLGWQQHVKAAQFPEWVCTHGDFLQGFPRYHTMEISHAFCRKFAMTPEQMMLRCVKYGDLPIKQLPANLSYSEPFKQFHVELCMRFLNLLLMYRTMACRRNKLTIRQLGELSKSTQKATYVTLDNVTGTARYETVLPSPNIILFTFSKVEERFIMSEQWQDSHQGLIDVEEYDAMRTLTRSQFKKLKYPTNRSLICKRRHLSKKATSFENVGTKVEAKQQAQEG